MSPHVGTVLFGVLAMAVAALGSVWAVLWLLYFVTGASSRHRPYKE